MIFKITGLLGLGGNIRQILEFAMSMELIWYRFNTNFLN